MITEAVIRVILHCSRCNTPFVDDDVAPGAPILWAPTELVEVFPSDMNEWDDVQGWMRVGARVLCPGCWRSDREDALPTEITALPAVDAANVVREQTGYTSVEALERVFYNVRKRPGLDDGWRPVTGTAGTS
ncbi:hypothetical protein [Actinomadura rubrisoli]|uniref:Uncharacterized protein n=1 Tax=Actinomadura rubrisoli TaxID=2530368 RepID=A0A4R5CC81_9ACTN|nr:hypothetical protein [Actinomadura rubrisoli]TDD97581.1 hypothetical protein E1298_00695 [Actinomadura rubrisoli]